MTSGSDYNRCTDIDVGTGICKHDNGACLKAVVDVVDRDYYWESVACNENLQAFCEYSCESDDTTHSVKKLKKASKNSKKNCLGFLGA